MVEELRLVSATSVQAPTFDALLWPTLKALRAMGGSASNEELVAKIIEIENISEQAAAVIHSDHRQTKLGYNLAWAKTYLKKVGAIDNSSRGIWAITEVGEKMTEADALRVPSVVRKQDFERRKSALSEAETVDETAEENSSESAMRADKSPPEESWKDRLLTALRAMEPSGFERLAQRLLREAGFIKVEVTGRSGDGGIDGQGVLRVNLLSFQVLFQCKRYQGTVSAGAVRDFRGAMVGRSDKGLIITTGTFSNDAKREATRDGAPAIDLIDGDHLCDLLKDLKLGVHSEIVERIVIETDWFARV